ncbi:hypothetical protein [Sphingomonas sp. VNH70]|uniref:hypothetical protein n=1 Tax=Sphingomonas silueang TaxID=3156617 RepID=UPI0032B4C33B
MTAAMLAGCGGGENTPAEPAAQPLADGGESGVGYRPPPPSSAAQGTAATQGIDCAANRPAAASGGRDIAGVTLGMPAEQAFAIVACTNPAFEVDYSSEGGFRMAKLPGDTQPRTQIAARAGLETMTLSLVGLPGQEQVVAIHRSVEFADGQEAPVETVLKRLTDKYGQPSYRYSAGDGSVGRYELPYSPDGKLLGPDNALFNQCTNDRSDGSMSISDACGISINFAVHAKSANPGLARSFAVALVDQRAAMAAIERFNQAAAAMAEKQRQGELNAAQQAVDAAGKDGNRMPTL